tara:strand:- start:1252 stop:1422 length:171 start_codon:yes stop_codon:yes gene_type:complete
MTNNNITDISITNLMKMLDMERFQDKDSQKMIQDELNFRNYGMSFDDMTNTFKEGN